MTPAAFLHDVLFPGISWYQTIPEWVIPTDDRARLLMLAIAGQESNWTERVQSGGGPAHGFWQFERLGGVQGVLSNPTTKKLATLVCDRSFVAANSTAVWGMLATAKGDHLATAFARLNLWPDPHPLPDIGHETDAWDCYVRVWRPGAVAHGGDRAEAARDRWTDVYHQSMVAMRLAK